MIIGKCPICGSDVFTFDHTPASDHPELTRWYIEHENERDCPGLEIMSFSFDSPEEAKTKFVIDTRRFRTLMNKEKQP